MADDTAEVTAPAISEKLATELGQYPGQWVAVFDGQLIAVGESAEAVALAARTKNITDPLIFRIPTHPEQLNFL